MEMESEAVAERTCLGESGLEEALARAGDTVYRYARFRLNCVQDAEDATMETLHALRLKPGPFLAAENPTYYALGVCRRKVADSLRLSRLRRVFRRPEPPDDLMDTQIEVHLALARLSDTYREVLALKYFHQLTQDEIARLTGKSSAAVNSLLQRARAALAAELPEERP